MTILSHLQRTLDRAVRGAVLIALLALGGCIGGTLVQVHSVDWRPYYDPEVVRWSARDGTLAIAMHNLSFAPGAAEQRKLAGQLSIPADYGPVRVIAEPAPGPGDHRLVLIGDPAPGRSSDGACTKPAEMAGSGDGGGFRALVAFCAGNTLASAGIVQVAAPVGLNPTAAQAINAALLDVLSANDPGFAGPCVGGGC